MSFLIRTSIVLCLACASVGCSSDDDNNTTNNNTTDANTSALSEADVMGVMAVINQGEIDQANVAKMKASRESVKSYADMMVTDHTAAMQRQQALATQLGVTPKESTVSAKVKADATAELTKLQGMSGSAFDDAYVASQITMHQKALDLIDTQLLPAAQRNELKAELQTARASVANHLMEARSLEGGGGDGGTSETGGDAGSTGGDGGAMDGSSSD